MSREAELVEVLVDLGVDVHKVHGDEINAVCPVHFQYKGRASTRNSWYMNVDTGLWHCFTCGGRGNLSQLLAFLADESTDLWQAHSYLISAGLERLTAEEEEYVEERVEIDWLKYNSFEQLPQRMLKLRKLSEEVVRRLGIRWDTDNKAVVTPIVSPLGELWGWQLKKTGWVRNHPEGVHKSRTLFGIERAHSDVAVLLESPLDVARFYSVCEADMAAVASFGANVSDDQIRLLTSRFEGVILALDNDKAGIDETKRLAKLLPSMRKGVRYWRYNSAVKDLGDMSDYEIVHGITEVSAVHHVHRDSVAVSG